MPELQNILFLCYVSFVNKSQDVLSSFWTNKRFVNFSIQLFLTNFKLCKIKITKGYFVNIYKFQTILRGYFNFIFMIIFQCLSRIFLKLLKFCIFKRLIKYNLKPQMYSYTRCLNNYYTNWMIILMYLHIYTHTIEYYNI